MLALAALVGCAVGPEELVPVPPRVEPEEFARAKAWVRALDAEGDRVVWASYDASSGKSAGATLETAPVRGGEPVVLFREPHPPHHLEIEGDSLFWGWEAGPLKVAPLAGGEPRVLFERLHVGCFDVDASGVYLIVAADVWRIDPASGARTLIGKRSLGDCPVALGDKVYWTERKGVFGVEKSAREAEGVRAVDLTTPKGLVARGSDLYTCVDDVLLRVDPAAGTARPVRDVCRGEGLVVGEGAHWFRAPYFEGWPPEDRARVAEVSSRGVSWLFDGLGASSPVIAGDHLVWFGRPVGGGVDWRAFRAPLPATP